MTRQLLAAIAALLLGTNALALEPHEHGVVRLDVAVEPGRVTLLMESPLANLVGFERAPRTDAERQRVDAALATLNAAATLFRIDRAAACVPSPVALHADALEGGRADTGHADIDASFSFKCRKVLPTFIDIGLFAAFPGMQQIEVQLVTGNTQSKRTLTRPAVRLSLTR